MTTDEPLAEPAIPKTPAREHCPAPQRPPRPGRRFVGRYRGDEPGPTLLCVAGIHGNEPAGLLALRRVFDELGRQRPGFAGELVGIAGNLGALDRGQRYLAKDLNRVWDPDLIETLRNRDPHTRPTAEDTELMELHGALRGASADSRGPVYLIDLHTTSSRSVPFGIIGDTLASRSFALEFGIPIVLGLEEHVDGALAEYAQEQGVITMGFEGGPHDDPASIDHHEAAIWIALGAAGNLAGEGRRRAAPHRRKLAEATSGIPRFMEIFGRYPIAPGDAFEMLPGFGNFQPVRTGQLVACDGDTAVRIQQAARLFMPLYQSLGDDGFFLARPVRPTWLKVSRLLRRLRLAAVAHWLPGVRRHPSRGNTVLVHPRIARWLVVQIFHLLGFRRRRSENGLFVFSRREHDVRQTGAPRAHPRPAT
jgi:succinylglutamate desuccinylase